MKKDTKPETKKGGSKVDGLRAERERRAEVREELDAKQKRCKHPTNRRGPTISGGAYCLDCGAVVDPGGHGVAS